MVCGLYGVLVTAEACAAINYCNPRRAKCTTWWRQAPVNVATTALGWFGLWMNLVAVVMQFQ